MVNQVQPITGLLKIHGVLHGEIKDTFGFKTTLQLPKVFAESTCNHLTQLLEISSKKNENFISNLFIYFTL